MCLGIEKQMPVKNFIIWKTFVDDNEKLFIIKKTLDFLGSQIIYSNY